MYMSVLPLAELVATDLRSNLRDRASGLSDVYGFCLWTDDINGDFLASVATEEEFERLRGLPGYASQPDELLFGAKGLRWNVGDWHKFPDDDFMTDKTKGALQPLAARLVDDSLAERELLAAGARWRDIAFDVFGLVQPLDLLPCAEGAIAFVEFADARVEERLDVMSRTVPASRMQALSAEWRTHGW
jgi:hypothetical protein